MAYLYKGVGVGGGWVLVRVEFFDFLVVRVQIARKCNNETTAFRARTVY